MENTFISSSGSPFILVDEKAIKHWNMNDIEEKYQRLITELSVSEEAIEEVEIRDLNFIALVEPENILKISDNCFIQIYACDFQDDLINIDLIRNIYLSESPNNTEVYEISLERGNYFIFSADQTYDEAINDNNWIQLCLQQQTNKVFWSYYQLNDLWFSCFLFSNDKNDLLNKS